MKCDHECQDYSTADKQKTELNARRVAWEVENIHFKVEAYTKLSLRHLKNHER